MSNIQLNWKDLESLKRDIHLYSGLKPDITADLKNYTFTIHGGIKPKIYKPSPTFVDFHKLRGVKTKLIMGPFSSGKSTGCCAEILFHTLQMPKCENGVRYSRWAIIRTTMGKLETTTLKTWLSWFKHLCPNPKRSKKPVLTYTYSFNDGGGPVELEIIFLALDREDDNESLESLELTGAYVNEMRHGLLGHLEHLTQRINRYPAMGDFHSSLISSGEMPYAGEVIADTNPPDDEHWIYRLFEDTPSSTRIIFHQPPALIKNKEEKWIINPQRDNRPIADGLGGIGDNYYLEMAEDNAHDQDHIRVYGCGEYGVVRHGKPVYHEFNESIHMVDDIPILQNGKVYVFWDFGLTPCALICQTNEMGQYRALKEFCSERSGIRQLATLFVLPYLADKFNKFEVISVGDPAGAKGSETDMNTCFNILEELGLPSAPASSNIIDTRLNAARYYFNQLIEGQPMFILSKSGCPTLRKALKSEYSYRRVRTSGGERYEDKPNKTHPWSDIADCHQYGALTLRHEFNNSQDSFNSEAFHQFSNH